MVVSKAESRSEQTMTNVAVGLSLCSPPRVPLSAETCPRPTPWFVWPMMTMTRTPNPTKWPRSRLSSAGAWRTSWRVPAPSAFPQQTTMVPCPGINAAPPSPAPATTTVPYTDLAAGCLLSTWVVQYEPDMAEYITVLYPYWRCRGVNVLGCFLLNVKQ